MEIEALEMYKKELEKIKARVVTKREKEILKLEDKIKNIDELDEDELLDLFGFDVISRKEYERRLADLRGYEKNKATFKYNPTALSLYLGLLDTSIKDINMQILMEKEDIK